MCGLLMDDTTEHEFHNKFNPIWMRREVRFIDIFVHALDAAYGLPASEQQTCGAQPAGVLAKFANIYITCWNVDFLFQSLRVS